MIGGCMSSGLMQAQASQNLSAWWMAQQSQGMAGNAQVPIAGFDPKLTDATATETKKPKETNMITEVAKDAKAFIKEHKSAIYWTVMLLIIDHFFFHGAFKEKLKATMQKLVGKVESKVASIEP